MRQLIALNNKRLNEALQLEMADSQGGTLLGADLDYPRGLSIHGPESHLIEQREADIKETMLKRHIEQPTARVGHGDDSPKEGLEDRFYFDLVPIERPHVENVGKKGKKRLYIVEPQPKTKDDLALRCRIETLT